MLFSFQYFNALPVPMGGGLADDGKRSDRVWSCTFYYASRREEKGEGLGEERARDRAGSEAGGFDFEVFLALFFNAVFSMRLQALFGLKNFTFYVEVDF